jgi:hypothetical protein
MTTSIQELLVLEATGKYVFHGSGHEIEEFEPRQAYNYREGKHVPDGEPAIYASPSVNYAWFMAVVNEVNCPNGHWSGAGTRTGTLRFRATQATLNQLKSESKGYVYVFNKEDFFKRDAHEYYSLEKRAPIKRIEVTFKDFPAPIDVMEDED